MTLRALLQRHATPMKRCFAGETLVRRNPLWYGAAARRFAGLAAAPPERRRAWEAARLRAALRRAAGTGYGRRVGGGEDLAAWPLLDPDTVRRAPRDFVRGGRWALPAATGGTTGVPLPLWRSWGSVVVEQAALDHLLRAHGVDPVRARVAVLRGDDVKDTADRTPPFWIDAQGGRRRIFSSNHLARDTVAAYAAALREFRADYWWVYPTTLGALLRFAAAAGEELSAPLLVSSSELLPEAVARAARDALGCRIADYYGQAERVAFAWCEHPGEWRFLPGYSHVELAPRGRDEAGWRFEVVGTGFWNGAMPLVRYRTGDLVRFGAEPDAAALEAIALGARTFPGVLGRDGDILVAPDGTQLTGIDHFHRGVDHVARIQVAHLRPDEVVIRVVPAAGFGESERAQLEANARRKLPPAIRIEVRVVDELERTPLGKTPFVVRGPGVAKPARGGTGEARP
jgi:phenylacetate-CoA ligase